MAPRFFAGASDPRVPALLRERLPHSVRRTVAAADRALEKRFDLLGYRDLSFGDPIDWHLDPVAKRQASLRHWTLLDPLDVATVGDSKVVWELNRHQWLVGLGQAYRLTGDDIAGWELWMEHPSHLAVGAELTNRIIDPQSRAMVQLEL